MTKKLVVAALLIAVFLLSLNGVLGEVSVGVKVGDWIEYEVSTSGDVPDGHDVTWAEWK